MDLEGQLFLPAQSVPLCPSDFTPLVSHSMLAVCQDLAYLTFCMAFCHNLWYIL